MSRVLVDADAPATWSSSGAAPSIHKSDEHAATALETTSTGLRLFTGGARSPSPPTKLSSVKHIFEKYCADEIWPECNVSTFPSSETYEENILPGVYVLPSSEKLADTHPAVRHTQEPFKERTHLWQENMSNNQDGYINNENNISYHPKVPSDITQSVLVQVDSKRSPLSSTVHDTQTPSALNNKTFRDHSQPIQKTLTHPNVSYSPRTNQNHLLNYGPTEVDTDSSLASSFKTESDIGQPDAFLEENTAMADHQAPLPSHYVPSSTSEHRISKGQGRPHRLSKLPDFHRLQVKGPSEKRSLLHQKLVQSGVEQSPDILGRYASWGSTDCDNGIKVRLYFPGQIDPTTGQDVIPLSLLVRTNASMENLVGFGLLSFVRAYGRYPTHPETTASSEPQMTTDAWNLRIVEDGYVDDDYPSTCYPCLPPAIDPNLNVGQFGEDEFAVCPELRSRTCFCNSSRFSFYVTRVQNQFGCSLCIQYRCR